MKGRREGGKEEGRGAGRQEGKVSVWYDYWLIDFKA